MFHWPKNTTTMTLFQFSSCRRRLWEVFGSSRAWLRELHMRKTEKWHPGKLRNRQFDSTGSVNKTSWERHTCMADALILSWNKLLAAGPSSRIIIKNILEVLDPDGDPSVNNKNMMWDSLMSWQKKSNFEMNPEDNISSTLASLHLILTSQQISVILRVSNGPTLTQTFLETSILIGVCATCSFFQLLCVCCSQVVGSIRCVFNWLMILCVIS